MPTARGIIRTRHSGKQSATYYGALKKWAYGFFKQHKQESTQGIEKRMQRLGFNSNHVAVLMKHREVFQEEKKVASNPSKTLSPAHDELQGVVHPVLKEIFEQTRAGSATEWTEAQPTIAGILLAFARKQKVPETEAALKDFLLDARCWPFHNERNVQTLLDWYVSREIVAFGNEGSSHNAPRLVSEYALGTVPSFDNATSVSARPSLSMPSGVVSAIANSVPTSMASRLNPEPELFTPQGSATVTMVRSTYEAGERSDQSAPTSEGLTVEESSVCRILAGLFEDPYEAFSANGTSDPSTDASIGAANILVAIARSPSTRSAIRRRIGQ